MATRSVVPRATGDGGLGTTLLRWATAFINAITCTTINALTLAAAAVGFTISGGTTSKTLTVTQDTSLDEAVAMSAKLTTPGAWTEYTPTITAGSGTLTTVAASGRWQQAGKIVFVTIRITVTTNGTGASYLIATLPGTAANFEFIFAGRNNTNGKMLQGLVIASASVVNITDYANVYPGADATTLYVSGVYEAA